MHTRHEMLELVVVDGVARGIVTRDLATGAISEDRIVKRQQEPGSEPPLASNEEAVAPRFDLPAALATARAHP